MPLDFWFVFYASGEQHAAAPYCRTGMEFGFSICIWLQTVRIAASGNQGGAFCQTWQVQVTGAGEEKENILRNNTTSKGVGAPHPCPLAPPAKTFVNLGMELDKKYLYSRLKHVKQIKKIRGEASTRSFYRVIFDNYSLVAMVYPGENSEEIEKIVKLTEVYLQNNIPVPAIRDVIDNRVVLLEDLGDLLVQKAFSLLHQGEKKKILAAIADLLVRLKGVSTGHTHAILDTARMKGEMDFFLTHFVKNNQTLLPGVQGGGFLEKSPPGRRRQQNNLSGAISGLRDCLYRMVECIQPMDTFAHRDFHSRNMLVYDDKIYLVDFQDSLVASPWYDLASFAFDCYLDLKSQRELLIALLQERGITVDRDQFYLAALQRNIKALGTFGYQVAVRENLAYRKYIPRTLRHILANPWFDRFFQPNTI